MISKKRLMVTNVAALLGLCVATQAHAELCADKKGQVFSRAQCKRKETIVPGTLGPIGPAGPQGVQGPTGPSAGQSHQATP